MLTASCPLYGVPHGRARSFFCSLESCRVLARRLTADTHCWLWRLSYIKLLVGLIWSGVVLLPVLSPAPAPLSMAQSRSAFTSTPSAAEPSAINPGPLILVATAPEAKPRLGWQAYLAATYVFGVAVCLGRLLLAARRTRRVLRSMVADDAEPETSCAASLAQGMKLRRTPPITRSAAVDSPVFIAGRVVLPSGTQYSQAEMKMILAHELAHARRRDLHWEWLGTLVQVVFFFHPLVVLARREERLAREAAADALALETTAAPAADYGQMLLSLALKQTGHRPMLIGAVGVIEGGTLLRRRLLALRDAASRTSTRRNRWRVALTLVPLMALVLIPWQMSRGQARPPAALSSPVLPSPVTHAYPTMPSRKQRNYGCSRQREERTGGGSSRRSHLALEADG